MNYSRKAVFSQEGTAFLLTVCYFQKYNVTCQNSLTLLFNNMASIFDYIKSFALFAKSDNRATKDAAIKPKSNDFYERDLKPIATAMIADADGNPTPAVGGRSSIPEGVPLWNVFQELSMVNPTWQIELLDVLNHLYVWNGDFGRAVWNIQMLSNTAHRIEFSSDVSEMKGKKARKHIEKNKDKWYKGGVKGDGSETMLTNDLLAQIGINGCLSAERVIKSDLSGIEQVVLVSPKNVRFVWSGEEGLYLPYQTLFNYNPKKKDAVTNTVGMNKLNTLTYTYRALTRINESPYPVPPMLSALGDIVVDKDIADNLKHVARKLGVLGFLTVLFNKPSPMPNEPMTTTQGQQAYTRRLNNHLQVQSPQITKGFRDGVVMGYNDTAFNMVNTTSDGNGATSILEANDKRKFSAMKQDGMFFGRHENVSEAIGRIVYSFHTAMFETYQSIVAEFYAENYRIELALQGIVLDKGDIKVKFDKPNVTDKLKDAQAKQLEIANAVAMYQAGLYSQEQLARALGIDEADQKKPREIPVVANGKGVSQQKKPKPSNATNGKKEDKAAQGREQKMSALMDLINNYFDEEEYEEE